MKEIYNKKKKTKKKKTFNSKINQSYLKARDKQIRLVTGYERLLKWGLSE